MVAADASRSDFFSALICGVPAGSTILIRCDVSSVGLFPCLPERCGIFGLGSGLLPLSARLTCSSEAPCPAAKSRPDCPHRFNPMNSHPHPKVDVCHRGSRDYYEAAVAFAEAGLLETLVTDIYLSPKSLPLSDSLYRRYPKLFTRSNPGLPSNQVITPPACFAFLICHRGRPAGAGGHIRRRQNAEFHF
jgi:hypothetical protein